MNPNCFWYVSCKTQIGKWFTISMGYIQLLFSLNIIHFATRKKAKFNPKTQMIL